MSSKQYWLRRDIKERERLIDTSISITEFRLRKQYLRSEQKIQKEMELLYDKIMREGGSGQALASHLYEFNRYYDLLNNMNTELTKLNSKEKVIFKSEFTDLYSANSKLLNKQLGLASKVNPEQVNKVINGVWCADGLNWSDRLWNHKSQLINTLTNSLVDCVATGASHEKLVKDIMLNFGSSYANASRLARTELSHIYNQSTKDKYEEAGIEQYRFLTAEDETTCDECGDLDGQVFNLEDAIEGENYPPIHPNCRCTVLAVIN